MQEPIIVFLIIFMILTIIIYQNYMVWFKYPIFKQKLVRTSTTYANKLNLPYPSRTISYVNSKVYKWIARLILLFLLISFSLPIILMIIFRPWKQCPPLCPSAVERSSRRAVAVLPNVPPFLACLGASGTNGRVVLALYGRKIVCSTF